MKFPKLPQNNLARFFVEIHYAIKYKKVPEYRMVKCNPGRLHGISRKINIGNHTVMEYGNEFQEIFYVY